ncbi:ion channel [Natronosalvus vescus]|uniref:ion channel n=1 Tax=Natronosalvus vescus TaxID=2953881 RepID=UPI002091988A|nr:ion channel [Natronosalvus vescus]
MNRFVRHSRLDSHGTVLVVVIIAVVSIATGLAAMVTEPLLAGEGYVGTLQTATGFSAVLVGFLLLAAAWGMRQGYRIAYVVALLMILLSAAHGIAQTRPISIPLVVLSTIAIVVLLRRQRREYTRSFSFTPTQIGALIAISGVVVYGTVGAYVLRTDLEGVETVLDGLYFTLVTASTVGYGDVYATSEAGRLFAITLILLGPVSIVAVAGTLFGPALESRLRRAGTRIRATQAERVTDGERVLLLAHVENGEQVVNHLADQASLTVVTPGEDWAHELEANGIEVHVGNPADDDVLERVTDAKQVAIVIATDAETTPYAVLAARRFDPDARVVAVTTVGHEADLAEMGADVTIDPVGLLARTTATAALGGDADSIR